jgi:hypothetical protein
VIGAGFGGLAVMRGLRDTPVDFTLTCLTYGRGARLLSESAASRNVRMRASSSQAS